MTFSILSATSETSINQLCKAYTDGWGGQYSLVKLHSLWYYTNTVNDKIVKCRAYYRYTGITKGYWCNYMDYDTTTGLYIFVGEGICSTSTNNNLTENELQQLTQYYPVQTTNICFPSGTTVITNKGTVPIEQIDFFNYDGQLVLMGCCPKLIKKEKSVKCLRKSNSNENTP